MKLIEIQPEKDFRLHLRFLDGTEGSVDLSEYAGKGVFSSWEEPGVFQQVVLADAGHPEWPGGLDLCPDSLYMRLTGKKPRDLFPVLHDEPSHA